MKFATAAEMAQIDRTTIDERKMPGLLLMEHAGIKLAQVVAHYFPDVIGTSFLIVAGGGNNGGDGFVLARLLAHAGAHVHVLCLKRADEYRGDAQANLEALAHLPLAQAHTTGPESFARAFDAAVARADVIVDAILGTGARGGLSKFLEAAVVRINEAGRFVLAVDVPTGLDPDSGQAVGAAIQADCTVTMGLPKRGFFHFPGAQLTGELWVADLGFPRDLTQDAPTSLSLQLAHELSRLLPPRERASHKGDHGRLLVIGGSRGMTGAALMAAQTAARVGAGLVKLLLPHSTWPHAAAVAPEVLVHPISETPSGAIDSAAMAAVSDHLEGVDVVLLGPGIGREAATVQLVRRLAESVQCPLVLDADGLRAIDRSVSFARREVVLTPHMGEAAHLLGQDPDELARDRFGALDRLIAGYHAHVILKGPYSLLGGPDGSRRINPAGNAGLATAGSGDVLAGTVAGLLATRQGQRRTGRSDAISLTDVVGLAAYVHGLAGELAVEELGIDRITAPDVLENVSAALARLAGLARGLRLESDRIRWI